MKPLFLFPIILSIIAAAVFLVLHFKKTASKTELFKNILLIIVLCCGISSMAFCFSAYYLSGDKSQLYKICLPLLIIVLAFSMWLKKKPVK
jgi:hypothetical protein